MRLGWVCAEQQICEESKCVQQQDMLAGDCSCFWWGSREVQNISVSEPTFSPLGAFVVFFFHGRSRENSSAVGGGVPAHPSVTLWVKHAGWAMEERGNINILQCNTFITAFKKKGTGKNMLQTQWSEFSGQLLCQDQHFHVKPRTTVKFRVLRWFIPVNIFLQKETTIYDFYTS